MATITDVFSGRTQYYGQMVVNQGTQSVEGNYTDVGFSLDIIESPEWGSYSFGSSSFSWNINGTPGSGTFTYDFRGGVNSKALASGAVRIYHNADGTMPSFGFSFSITAASPLGSAAASGSMGLTTIPRATQPTVSPTSGNTGSSYTIGIAPASGSFRHDVFYSLDGGGSYTQIATDIAGNTTWTPAHTLLPNSTSVTAIILVRTKSGAGGSTIGDKTVSLPLTVPSSVKPTISSVAWAEAQVSAPDLVTMMGGAGRFVQRWSKLKPTVTSAGAGGSTVVSSSVTQNGQVTPSGTAFSLPVALSGAVPYSASVIDSRNVTSDSYANTVAVTAYNFPNLPTPLIARTSDAAGNIPSPTGTYLAIIPAASVSSLLFGGVQKNVLEWQVRTMPKGGAWTTKQAWTTTGVSGTTWTSKYVVAGYASNTEWVVEVSVRDVFGKNGYSTAQTVAVLTVGVPSEQVFFDWDGNNGLGLGKYRTNGMLDVAGAIYQNNGQAVASQSQLWSSATAIGNAADLNSYTTPGAYHQAANAQAATGTNYPSPAAGVLEVLPTGNASFMYQRYTLYGPNNATYVRRFYSGTWYPWEMLLSDKNRPVRVCRLLKTSAQNTSSTAGQGTQVTWTSDSTASGMWSAGQPTLIVPNATGWWKVAANIRVYVSGTVGYAQVQMNAANNSPSESLAADPTGTGAYINPTDIFKVTSVGVDYFQTAVYSTGVSRPLEPGNCRMEAVWLGPL